MADDDQPKLKKDGTPRKKSGPKPGTMSEELRAKVRENAKAARAKLKAKYDRHRAEGKPIRFNQGKRTPEGDKAIRDALARSRKLKTLARQQQVIERVIAVKEARNSLHAFTRLSMPSPEDPGDATKSRYEAAKHHLAIMEALEKVERGEITRLIITMPPRHGKSELASRRFPAWFVGKDPTRQVIFTSYGQEFSEEFGREWRDIFRSPAFRQVFPGVGLKHDSATAHRMQMCVDKVPSQGMLVAVGVGGPITGRGADLLLIDDPIKNDEEAESALYRDRLWTWYCKTAYHRLMPGGRIVIIMTRWHDDDLVGRLTDPTNPHYDAEEAATWTILKLPAIKDGQALWPERYPIKTLESIRRTLRSRAFSALYQQDPTPEDGAYFASEMLVTYNGPGELPKHLRMYAASDHALTVKQENDASVLGCFGVDDQDHIWIMPDLFWGRVETDAMLDEMLALMRRHKPQLWFAEDEHINKALGPFRRRRMQEERIYTAVHGIRPHRDLRARARSIQGRMAMGMVHFPRFTHWWPDAEREILRFDRAPHDDFVAFLALIGLGMDAEIAATLPHKKEDAMPKTGSIPWLKRTAQIEERRAHLRLVAGGF